MKLFEKLKILEFLNKNLNYDFYNMIANKYFYLKN